MPEAAQNPRAERPRTPELTPAQTKSRIDNIRFGWGPRFEQARLDPNNVGDMPQEIFKKSWGAYFSDLSRMSGATTTTQQETICRGWAEALTVLAKQDPKHEAVESTKKLFGVEGHRLPTAGDLINYTSGRFPTPGRRAARPTPEPTPETEGTERSIWEEEDDKPEPKPKGRAQTRGKASGSGDLGAILREAAAAAGVELPTAEAEAEKQAEPEKPAWQEEYEAYQRKLKEEADREAEEGRRRFEEEAALRRAREAATRRPATPEPTRATGPAPELEELRRRNRAKVEQKAREEAQKAVERQSQMPAWKANAQRYWERVWREVSAPRQVVASQPQRQRGFFASLFSSPEEPKSRLAILSPEQQRSQALVKGVERIVDVANRHDFVQGQLEVEADMLITQIGQPRTGIPNDPLVARLRSKYTEEQLRAAKRRLTRDTHPDFLKNHPNGETLGHFNSWFVEVVNAANQR